MFHQKCIFVPCCCFHHQALDWSQSAEINMKSRFRWANVNAQVCLSAHSNAHWPHLTCPIIRRVHQCVRSWEDCVCVCLLSFLQCLETLTPTCCHCQRAKVFSSVDITLRLCVWVKEKSEGWRCQPPIIRKMTQSFLTGTFLPKSPKSVLGFHSLI